MVSKSQSPTLVLPSSNFLKENVPLGSALQMSRSLVSGVIGAKGGGAQSVLKTRRWEDPEFTTRLGYRKRPCLQIIMAI